MTGTLFTTIPFCPPKIFRSIFSWFAPLPLFSPQDWLPLVLQDIQWVEGRADLRSPGRCRLWAGYCGFSGAGPASSLQLSVKTERYGEAEMSEAASPQALSWGSSFYDSCAQANTNTGITHFIYLGLENSTHKHTGSSHCSVAGLAGRKQEVKSCLGFGRYIYIYIYPSYWIILLKKIFNVALSR